MLRAFILLGKCPTSCQLVEGFVSRPLPEASTSRQPMVSTHLLAGSCREFDRLCNLFEFIETVMLKRIQHRQQTPQASQQRWLRGMSPTHLASAQSQQQGACAFGFGRLRALQLPDHYAGQRHHTQSFADRFGALLLPLLEMPSVAFEQLDIGLHSPPPVV